MIILSSSIRNTVVHAYDYDQIAGASLTARRAAAGEELHTLDDSSRKARGEELVIADAEKAAGLAGVMGSDEVWETATNGLRNALEHRGLKYVVNEGDGAFYGPKIDFHLRDSIGRTWQCGTIQLDMLLPEKFDLTYVGEDGQKHRPVMVHRVVYGSIERFIGILIENYAGAFPVWLAPVQVKILPITDKHMWCRRMPRMRRRCGHWAF